MPWNKKKEDMVISEKKFGQNNQQCIQMETPTSPWPGVLSLSLQSSVKTEPRRLSLTLLNDNDSHCMDINAGTKRREAGEKVCDYVSREVWVYDPDKMAQVTWNIGGNECQSRGWFMEWEMKGTMDCWVIDSIRFSRKIYM